MTAVTMAPDRRALYARIGTFSAIALGGIGLILPWATFFVFSFDGLRFGNGKTYGIVLLAGLALAGLNRHAGKVLSAALIVLFGVLAGIAVHTATQISGAAATGTIRFPGTVELGFGMYLSIVGPVAGIVAVVLGLVHEQAHPWTGSASAGATSAGATSPLSTPPVALVPLPRGTPAQWTADPARSGLWRYWDGIRWTAHLSAGRPAEEAPTPGSSAAPRP